MTTTHVTVSAILRPGTEWHAFLGADHPTLPRWGHVSDRGQATVSGDAECLRALAAALIAAAALVEQATGVLA